MVVNSQGLVKALRAAKPLSLREQSATYAPTAHGRIRSINGLTTSTAMVFSERDADETLMDAGSFITALEQLLGPVRDSYSRQSTDRSQNPKPPAAAVRQYEAAVYAFREQRLPGEIKGVSALLVESLDAFEAGRILEAARCVMQAIEQFEAAGKDAAVTIAEDQSAKLGQFRSVLFKLINPGPELNQQDIIKKRTAAQNRW